jgi:hypothetical protein
MSERSSPTETSVIIAIWHMLRSAASETGSSWVMTHLRRATALLTRAVRSSGLAAIGTHIARWTRESFLYRWLTAEPDPEVIVIDLRETYTVGPVLAVLDRAIAVLSRGWDTASTGSLTQTTHGELREHPVRTVSLVALVVLLTSLVVSVVLVSPSSTGLGARLIGIGLAALGTRIRVSWDQCTESATYRYLVAALEPPEPPESNEFGEDSER